MAAKNFTKNDIKWFLEDSWAEIQRRWPDDFKEGIPPHYMCECCGFISSDRQDFEIDHVKERRKAELATHTKIAERQKGVGEENRKSI
jgi:hypothetical protein